VDDPPLVRRHRLQHDRPAGAGDLAADPLGQPDQRLLPAGAVALDVDDDAGPVVQPPVAEQVDQVLELGQVLAAAADQHPEVLAEDVDEDRRRLGRLDRHRGRIVDGQHLGPDAHLPEQLADDLLGDALVLLVDPVVRAGHPLGAGRRAAAGRAVAGNAARAGRAAGAGPAGQRRPVPPPNPPRAAAAGSAARPSP
jgi:hypothetical protein